MDSPEAVLRWVLDFAPIDDDVVLRMEPKEKWSKRIREGQLLKDENAFAEWAQVVLVAAAHIRDCLVTQSQQVLVLMTKGAQENLGPEVNHRTGSGRSLQLVLHAR